MIQFLQKLNGIKIGYKEERTVIIKEFYENQQSNAMYRPWLDSDLNKPKNFLDNQENLKHELNIKELLLTLLGMNSTVIMFCFVLFFSILIF